MTDIATYISGAELSVLPSRFSLPLPAAALRSFVEAGEDPSAAPAAIDAGSLVSFVDGLDADEKDDVLYSVQFAQRAANQDFDRFARPRDWYHSYAKWLETLGWVTEQFGFSEYEMEEGEIKMHAAALKVLAAVATANQLAVFQQAIAALGALADEAQQIKLFDFHTSVEFGGNFQIGAAQKSANGAIAMALGAFYYRSVDHKKNILFWSWGDSSINFWTGAQKMTFNRTIYAQLRGVVMDKLGAERLRDIAAINFK